MLTDEGLRGLCRTGSVTLSPCFMSVLFCARDTCTCPWCRRTAIVISIPTVMSMHVNSRTGILFFCAFFLFPFLLLLFVCHEAIKRELKRRPIYECRCDETLKAKAEGSTRLGYTGLRRGLDHLKVETRLIDERFASEMCECVI
jgi:hypothetical protein